MNSDPTGWTRPETGREQMEKMKEMGEKMGGLWWRRRERGVVVHFRAVIDDLPSNKNATKCCCTMIAIAAKRKVE